MILFCDTSALVKLYIIEEDSNILKREVAQSEGVAVCRIAWAEAHAAFARRTREVRGDAVNLELAKTSLNHDWLHYIIMEVTQAVVERAGEFADTFALRGYDSIQLAAASELARATDLEVTFACFDRRLNKAANVLGMETLSGCK